MNHIVDHIVESYLRPWNETDWTGNKDKGELPPCEDNKKCMKSATQILIVEIDGEIKTGTFYCDEHAKEQGVGKLTYANKF